MKAKYAIYYAPPGVARSLVDYIIIDTSGDPNSNHNRAIAICASDRGGSDYDVEFIGADGPTVDVPFALIERLVEIVKIYRDVTDEFPDMRTCTMNAVVKVVGEIAYLPVSPE
jgi:hypothetical protein